MNRRRILKSAGAGIASITAGCALGDDAPSGSDIGSHSDTVTKTSSDKVTTQSSQTTDGSSASNLRNPDLPLTDADFQRGAPKDAIAAIVDPAFGSDWSELKWSLDDEERVIGVARNKKARAYPLAVLNWHEIVNDDFDGPLLVSYCPLCGSGVTAKRLVSDKETIFGVSGLLWMSDLVMYDRLTESLWSQILGKAIKGPKTGTSLSLLPSTITTWKKWRTKHPNTEVLYPPPRSLTIRGDVSRNYDHNRYTGYQDSNQIGITRGGRSDGPLDPKALVIGVATDEAARAYPFKMVENAGGVVNDRVGNLPVVVAAADDGSLVAYVRRIDNEILNFSRDDDVLSANGSHWEIISGKALDGPHEGIQLKRANDRSQMFWFAWVEFYPNTEIFGQND